MLNQNQKNNLKPKQQSKSHLVTISDELWETLDRLANEQGVSKSAMIRMLIIKENKERGN